ncbi:MAG TPA: adenylyltransferase/cytidyltransferase family protein [Solirubrobacteraceae bacterium]|nr:adenylyltransferase/cytidyltransferase family protein [Solirubrobacteraceae bacterium]
MSAPLSASPEASGYDLHTADGLWLRWFTAPPLAGPETVVATGVFDLLHVGHVRFLRAARAAGRQLVVGIEDDERTRVRKGAGRPFQSVEERCELVASLWPVDAVFAISGSPEVAPIPGYRELLAPLAPARLAFTAGDPAAAGRRAVAAALGAGVVEIPYVPHRSTTAIIASLALSRSG